MRFLVSRLSSLGDVVCTLPAAVALKRTFPESEVVWCVDPRFAGIVELCRSVDRTVVLPQSLSDKKRAVSEVGRFDAAFDLQGLLKSAVVVGWCQAERKLGYHWRREGSWLFSQRVLPDPTSLHVTDQYVDVVRAAGAEADAAEFDLVPDPADVAKFAQYRGLVVCNAGAGWASKRWPPSHFAALANAMNQKGLRTAFIGSPSDRAVYAEVVSAGAKETIDLVGKTSVRELVALVSLARAHVGGDTGSTHIAAALGVPAIGLYSVTRPERSCPYGQRHNTLYDPRGLEHILPGQALDLIGQNL